MRLPPPAPELPGSARPPPLLPSERALPRAGGGELRSTSRRWGVASRAGAARGDASRAGAG
ncbi:MAG: hypothetical protein ACREMZ_10035, partial [Gemmatimonadales bacterium]